MGEILPNNMEMGAIKMQLKRRVGKLVILFRISLGLFLLLSLLLSGCSSGLELSWQLPKTDSLKSLINQAVKENTELSVDLTQQSKVAKISKNLFLIDYNVDEVCGYYGCLYSLYILAQNKQDYQHIWSSYFQPYHPPEKPLFAISRNFTNPQYPCFQIHQVKQQNYLDLTYCFDGNTYRLSKSSIYNISSK